MATTLTIYDETIRGECAAALTLIWLTERITARELIRRRVYEEVRQRNLRADEQARMACEVTEKEKRLNGERTSPLHTVHTSNVDWETQVDRALDAFRRNRFFLLVDDRQIEDLDTDILLKPETQVTFLRLVPLAGG